MNENDSTAADVNVYTVGDMVDKAIIHLSAERELGKLSLQKGVFIYLLSISKRRGYNSEKVLEIAGFEPYKLGPFSEFINGEVEQLKGYNEVKTIGIGENMKVKSNWDSPKKYKLDQVEKLVIENVKTLIYQLQPMELTFYVYFNPAFDQKIRNYFTHFSEIKNKLIKERERYVRKLKDKGIVDEDAAKMILYAESKN